MENLTQEFKEKINSYNKTPILVTDHSYSRIKSRNFDLNAIFYNILNNVNLINVIKQNNCKYLCTYKERKKPKHYYVIELKEKQIELITVWKENTKIQKKVNKNAKKISKL